MDISNALMECGCCQCVLAKARFAGKRQLPHIHNDLHISGFSRAKKESGRSPSYPIVNSSTYRIVT